jgi:hypothetical protein
MKGTNINSLPLAMRECIEYYFSSKHLPLTASLGQSPLFLDPSSSANDPYNQSPSPAHDLIKMNHLPIDDAKLLSCLDEESLGGTDTEDDLPILSDKGEYRIMPEGAGKKR